MYLLMLLATYISAIYGFNLSARPDYDRDIVRKKASAAIYRFNYQAYVSNRMLATINFHHELGGHPYPHGMQPGDKLYAAEGSDNTMILKQEGDEAEIALQGDDSAHLLPQGRKLYPSDEMISVVYCLPPKEDEVNKFYDLNDYEDSNLAKNCTSTPVEGMAEAYEDSCCFGNAHRYLISFKQMDARWINRISNRLNYDFHRALIDYPFTENIGYVYYDGEDAHWHFDGKIKLLPVYVEEMNAWESAHVGDEDLAMRQFPSKLRNKTKWKMPKHFFDASFFTVNGINYCQKGCLFKIRKI